MNKGDRGSNNGRYVKDTDGNYLAVCRAPEAAENGLRLDALGNLISIAVLMISARTAAAGGGVPERSRNYPSRSILDTGAHCGSVVRLVADHLHRVVLPPSEAERYAQAAAVVRHQRRHGHAPHCAGRLVDDRRLGTTASTTTPTPVPAAAHRPKNIAAYRPASPLDL